MRLSISTLIVFLTMTFLASCAAQREIPSVSPQQTLPFAESQYQTEREQMVEDGIAALGIKNEAVLEAMRQVPRHRFVPASLQDQAYANIPLPIGYGQTISQPYIVALMTEQLAIEAGDRVLEVGTGSGYQAAILAQMGVDVYTIEIIQPLAEQAASLLRDLGYFQVHVLHADGYYGWPDEAPFDAIIVTAAPDHVPQPLMNQLKEGARLIIPVGPVGGIQELWRIERSGDDEYQADSLGGVRFVPFTRDVIEQ